MRLRVTVVVCVCVSDQLSINWYPPSFVPLSPAKHLESSSYASHQHHPTPLNIPHLNTPFGHSLWGVEFTHILLDPIFLPAPVCQYKVGSSALDYSVTHMAVTIPHFPSTVLPFVCAPLEHFVGFDTVHEMKVHYTFLPTLCSALCTGKAQHAQEHTRVLISVIPVWISVRESTV